MFYMLVLRQLNTLQIYQCMGCLLRIFKKEVLKSREVTQMESEVQSLPAMNKALGSVSKYRRRDGSKFDIVKFLILFLKDRWLSNTSFFFPFFFSSKPTLRYKTVYGSIVPTRKVGQGWGQKSEAPQMSINRRDRAYRLLEVSNGPQTHVSRREWVAQRCWKLKRISKSNSFTKIQLLWVK